MFSPASPLRAVARAARASRPAAAAARIAPSVSVSAARVIARTYADAAEKKDEAKGDGEAGAAAGAGADADKVKSLEDKIKLLEKDILYHRAEAQTLSRRVDDERRKASEFAISKFAQSLLSTTDTFDIALKHVPSPIEPGTPLASLVQGIELTRKALLKTFEQNGVRKMDVVRGSAFDPNLHEATFQIPKEVAGPKGEAKGEWGSGEVVEVAKEGWMIGARVLRPAQVGVTQIE